MPELAKPLERNIAVQNFAPINPASYISSTPPPAPIVDTSGLSDAQGKASLYSSVAKVLADLPETITKAYETGRNLKVGNQVTKQYETALQNNDQGALMNFKASSEGGITYAPQDAELRRLQVAALTDKGTTVYDRNLAAITGNPVQRHSALPLSSVAPSPVAQLNPAQVAPSIAAKGGALSAVEPTLPVAEPTGQEPSGILPPETHQVAGKDASQKALSGIVESAAEPKGKRELDPVSGVITITSPEGHKYENLPGTNTYNPVKDPADKETPTENALNRAIIARGKNPIGMSLDQKEEFLKTEVPLKPSEKLSATRDLRQSYQGLPSTTLLFGKGQVPGLDQVIQRLDEIKKSAGDDFSKLTPQQGRSVVFSMSKFNDPTSAVLLSEYKAAADTLSIPDRLFQVINKAATGESVTPEQAQDIYNTIKAAHERAKQNYLQDSSDIMAEAKAMGISNRRLGIPKQAEEWAMTPNPDTSAKATEAPAKAVIQASGAGSSRDTAILVDSPEAYASVASGLWIKDSNGKIGKKP